MATTGALTPALLMKQKSEGDLAVAEIQGLYGPFTFPEKLLQQIWLRGDFALAHATTTDGRTVQVIRPGHWNQLGGPDFKGARLAIGGVAVTGDVEVHLHAADWAAHRHAFDPAYADVVLHVILFPTEERATAGVGGREIPLLVLLPLLNHDLEEYAADEAIERLADHPLMRARRELTSMSAEKLAAEFQHGAEVRWQQKIHYAELRIDRLGWEPACHHTALEILGYRFNRAPMLTVAGAVPLADWACAGEGMGETVYSRFTDTWNKQGVRPANHPRTRLCQYGRWVAARPDWPRRWERFADELPAISLVESRQTATVRRKYRWTELTHHIAAAVFGGEIGGTRFNTLVCDGLLPLLAARVGGDERLAGVWFAWPAGDIPARYARLLRELGVVDKRHRPMSHGVVQGLIQWLLVADQRHEAGLPTTEGGGA